MANFLLAYHGGGEMPSTPEAQAASMKAWMDWFGGLGDAVVDGGNPCNGWSMVGAQGVTTGGGAAPVTGYSILRADDMAAAVKMAQGCPLLQVGGSVQVCETFNAM